MFSLSNVTSDGGTTINMGGKIGHNGRGILTRMDM